MCPLQMLSLQEGPIASDLSLMDRPERSPATLDVKQVMAKIKPSCSGLPTKFTGGHKSHLAWRSHRHAALPHALSDALAANAQSCVAFDGQCWWCHGAAAFLDTVLGHACSYCSDKRYFVGGDNSVHSA
jgi:hypothetical protein